MIQFHCHIYTMVPKTSLNNKTTDLPREGALFKMKWPDGKIGYADCFPWPEFGDDPIRKQIDGLKKGKLSLLMEQTVWLGRKDAEIRWEKKNGLGELRKIKNHYTVTDLTKFSDVALSEAKNQGFTTFKIKVGRDPQSEAKWIEQTARKNPYLGFRLDFNGNTDFSAFERLASAIPASLKSHIEFAEDPVPYSLEAWREASRLLPLAVDFEAGQVDWTVNPLPFRTLVLKPARQDVVSMVEKANKHNLKIVVTSAMDHAVGIVHALRVAADIKKMWPGRLLECGCLTQHLYWPDDFTAKLVLQGPCLLQVNGTGIGFDGLFEKLEWTYVRG